MFLYIFAFLAFFSDPNGSFLLVANFLPADTPFKELKKF
jgi:hypothetical protein